MVDFLEKIRGQRIAVTGSVGTVGSEIVRQALDLGAAEVVALDNSETGMFYLERQFDNPKLKCFVSDIQNVEHLNNFFKEIDIVFHCAAFKHVPSCEVHPRFAVENNILGTQNVIDAALKCGVKRVLFTSSDKAVNPTNVMGTTKLMGERMVTAANTTMNNEAGTIFASTRFGNVAGSNGSVIDLFMKLLKENKDLTLTDPNMTRFMMTLEDSARLVMNSVFMAMGGEVFVTKMPVLKISDLASEMASMYAPTFGFNEGDVKIKTIGIRTGEKLYEELMTNEELPRSWERQELFVILPAFRNIYTQIDYSVHEERGKPCTNVYNSAVEKPLDRKGVREFLMRLALV